MAMKKIQKRDGRIVEFDEKKIAAAITKAFDASQHPNQAEIAARLAAEVASILEVEGISLPGVEHVQDLVERVLMDNGFSKTAKAYILYRNERTRSRNFSSRLMRAYSAITYLPVKDSNVTRENADIAGGTAMSSMLRCGSEGAKAYYETYVLRPEFARAHDRGDIYIHDLDFYAFTTAGTQIDILQLFHGGFSTGFGHLQEPDDIAAYSALTCIAIQANQNDQHGGQSIVNFDYGMAEGIRKTFIKKYRENLSRAVMLELGRENAGTEIRSLAAQIERSPTLENCDAYLTAERPLLMALYCLNEETVCKYQAFAYSRAVRETDGAAYQAMEALLHTLNTMQPRAGAQVPFSSLNYGMDTSPEGRMAVKNLLLATIAGLGNGETPMLPIQIFRVKEGVNYQSGDPNYDLFQLACRCTAKRLFPNFSFLDAPFNARYYQSGHPETEIAYMDCHMRVMGNVYDPTREISSRRGNLSSTSINLPRLGMEAHGNLEVFYRSLDSVTDLCVAQLLERFEIQCRRKARNFPFLMGQGVWLDSEKLNPGDEVRKVLQHGTLSVGFVGLAETLVALTGKHHGQSEESQELGLNIIRHLRERMDVESRKRHLNFTLLATPAAEGLAGRFVQLDRARYGTMPGVTDREHYTNSFHIPVYFPISAYRKIQLEAPYHALTNAGHITYIEMDGDPSQNPEAFEAVLRCMKESGIGYGSINHAAERDPICG